MMKVAINKNLINGFFPISGVQHISNLQFADDTFLFCDAEEDQLRNIKVILLCFKAVSGLRINLFKSELIGIKVNEDWDARLGDILWCKAGSLPTSYLGLPLCIVAASASLWNPVPERLEKKHLCGMEITSPLAVESP